MNKYLAILRTTLAEYSTYRLNFLLWRFRVVLNLLIIFFLWSSIFSGKANFFHYTKEQMLTYILLSSFISNFALGTRTNEIASEILQGDIINKILKPVSFFKYYFSRDLIDKLVNLLFSLVEVSLIMILLKPALYSQTNALVYLLFFVLLTIGTLISFFINLSLSFLGFWTTEVWAPRFIYFILIMFLSGSYFPLDILPKSIYYFFLATPFPYLYYLPAQIYLKGLTPDLFLEIIMSLVWILLSYALAKFLWQKGLKSYSGYGR